MYFCLINNKNHILIKKKKTIINILKKIIYNNFHERRKNKY